MKAGGGHESLMLEAATASALTPTAGVIFVVARSCCY
jgi:hypothetical protein